jgi:APA family basic amino acid/polyamine antiporter
MRHVPAPTGLRRTLGLWHATASGIGVILGAGVYALIAPAAARAGSVLWLSFLIAAAAAALTGYSYARLGSMRPRNSPEFQYTALAFGPRTGFVAGWLMLVADLLAASAVALGFGGYFAHLTATPTATAAAGLLLAMGLVLHLGIAGSVVLAILLTAVEAAGLVFVIVVGAPSWLSTDYLDAPGAAGGVWSAAALIFFAYLGFDELGNLAEEMREPERDLPRAIFLALAATTAIYIALALSAVGAVGWRDLAASPAPLALVARRVLGPRADAALSLIALAATANTVLLLLLSASRSMHGMAAARQLPGWLASVGRRATPALATWTTVAVTALVALATDLVGAAEMSDAAVLGSFVLVNASLVWLGLAGAAGRGGWRTADVVVPAAAILACVSLLVHIAWTTLVAAAGVAVAGLVLRRMVAPAGR